MKIINGGVCAAQGFKANGIHCGIRKNKTKKDLALIYSEVPATAAAVYTTNLVKGAPLYVSMAAGVPLAILTETVRSEKVIRIMPNTPVAVGQGMILYCYNALTTKEQTDAFLHAMAHAGRLELLAEDLFDAGTSVSGCGPAFAYLFADALAKGGEDCGLSYGQGTALASQMLLGAALMLQEDGRSPDALREAVCSKGGSTIEGVKVMWEKDLAGIIRDAVKASYKRNQELGKS